MKSETLDLFRIELFLTLLIASVTALHQMALIGMLSGHSYGVYDDSFQAVLGRFLNLLQGSEATSSVQTRPLVPILLTVIHRIFGTPAVVIFALEFLSSILVSVSFLWVSRFYLENRQSRILGLLLFSLMALAAQKDIGRLGDLFHPGFFLLGLALFEIKPFSGISEVGTGGFLNRGALKVICLLSYVLFSTLSRYDTTMLVLFILFLQSLFERNQIRLFTSVIAAGFSSAVYFSIIRFYGIHDLLDQTFLFANSDTWVYTQTLNRFNWFMFLSFLNLLILVPWACWREVKRSPALFWGTVVYSIFLFFCGNMGEYRLWLPLAAILCLFALSHLEKETGVFNQA